MSGRAEGSRSVTVEEAKEKADGPSRILAGAWAFTRDERTADKAWLKQAETPIGGRRDMKHPGIIAVMGLNRA